VGPLVGLVVGPPGVRPPVPRSIADVREAAASGAYSRLFHALVARGVALAPGPYEVLFPGFSHDDGHLAGAVSAAGEAAREVTDHWA
jgi:glutamate-1-semialdehyde 2,1-aminomutase